MSTTARTGTGDLQIPRVIVLDPAQVALQGSKDVLALWAGSWYRDTGAGFPWMSLLGQRNISPAFAKALLRQALLSVAYVISVTVDVAYVSQTRAFAYTFAATIDTGEVITGGSSQPFRVQPSTTQATGSS